MRIAISGTSGLVGSLLKRKAEARGHTCLPLVRSRKSKQPGIYWNWREGAVEAHELEGVDCLVHLAGESIASGRWTEARKRSIKQSRIAGTRLLVDALADIENPPSTFLCASAIGFYGSRGSEVLDESSREGQGYLAEVCTAWENTANTAAAAGIRTVNLRIGMVLDPAGGALAKMLLPFKLGLGGRVGSGEQYISWITNEDLTDAIFHIIGDENLSGPVNMTAPHPVTNAEFTKSLGRALSRPTLLPLPAAAVRLLFGEMGEELLLISSRVRPAKLEQENFTFSHPTIDEAFRALELS